MDGELLDDLNPRQRATTGEDVTERTELAGGSPLVQPEFRPSPPRCPREDRAEERQKPPKIARCQQVQGAAHAPGTHNRPLVHAGVLHVGGGQPGGARPDGQGRRRPVLGLDAADLLHDVRDARD